MERGDAVAKGAADQVAQGEHGWIADRVDHAVPGPGALDDACSGEQSEVLGRVLLAQAQAIRQFADGRRSGSQRVEQLDSSGLAEDPEPVRDQLHQGVGQRRGNIHEPIIVTTIKLYSCEATTGDHP